MDDDEIQTSTASAMVITSASSPLRSSFRQQQNISVDTSSYQRYLSDRRRSFRFRGFGSTVVSAPSVEHEDYRCTRPSITAIKSGKSFDLAVAYGGGADKNGSTNALYKVRKGEKLTIEFV